MARLRLSLLGTLSVTLDGQPVTGFESGKVRALLAYLAAQPERAYNRGALTGLLWPEQPEEAARANLRQALSNLRRNLGGPDIEPPFLLVSRDAVQFNPASDAWQDLAAFTKLLDECNRHAHRRPELCTPCAQRLARAVELYRGPFLDGLFVHESVAFEEWMLLQREVFQRRALRALYQLATYYERRGAYDEAYSHTLRQIELDPWREEAHRQAMRVLILKGERSEALAQYETCRRLLDEGLGVEPAKETTALYERIRSADVDEPLKRDHLALPSSHPHNLPPQPTSFIGREQELAELARLIEQPEHRLISLVGQGGSGKTRMALQAASEQIEAFADGVRFVPLGPFDSSDYLVSTIGAALGVSFSSQKDARTQLLDELRDKEMLLVLDNFEYPVHTVDLLPALLQKAPRVVVLTTTRERLSLQGEWVMRVEGLPYPEDEASEPPESFPSVQLFLQSARRMDSRFALSAAEGHAVARICRMVGGLPLAIELAAAWAPVLSSDEIRQEIAKNLDFLATNLRDIPERHRSIRAVFDHSWNMLSDEERDLFARLSVFRGGFRREAAEQAADATLPLLSSLVAKSFLQRSPLGRYEVHELLRQYAEGKLRDSAQKGDDARNRHCRYYAESVERHEKKLRGEDQLSAIEEISAEVDNVREAWRWGVDHRRWEEVAKLVEGVWFFYEIRGMWPEGDEAFERAAIALSSDTGEEGTRAKQRAILLGEVLARRGAMLGCRMGRTDEGRDLLEQSIALLKQFDARREAAFSLNILGTIARLSCRYEQAKGYFQESLDLYRDVGDQWGIAYSRSDLGNIAYLLGEYSEARRLHEESLLISRQSGDRRAMMYCLNDRTSVAIAVGEYDDGMEFSRKALAMAEAIGHPWGRATALYQQGIIASYTGDYVEAEALLQESQAAFQGMGDRQAATIPLQQLGYLAFLQKDHAQAQHLLLHTLSICRETGYRRGTVAALNVLGRVAHEVGKDETARSYLREALATALEIRAWPLVLNILVSRALAVPDNTCTTPAWRIFSLASRHPATEHHTREEARKLLARFEQAEATVRDAKVDHLEPAASLQRILDAEGLV